ncbi:OCIA domain-containing protein 1 isoform X2 [Amia ocellicauda]|uniref:OCIA domain-containing protein 1 isoform X2 n=1 Tax=Amia ocellicauda TaxID=2972642 RepID=UPI003463DB82
MSQASAGLTGSRQQHGGSPQNPLGVSYIPTEEERRVFKECNKESLYYRSLPFSAIGMVVTRVLISRGILTSSPRFGPMPKVMIAGVCGFLAGKMSYMRTCQEKFKSLDNSPLGEVLRHRSLPPQAQRPNQAEETRMELESEYTLPQSSHSPADSYSPDFSSSLPESSYEPPPFSSTMSESAPSGVEELGTQAPLVYLDEEKPKKKSIMYEQLRSKNRENYEVTMTQKAETLMKPSPERAPKTEVKKNIYGDTWEE